MILCHPQIESLLNISSSRIQTLVIEEPRLFRTLLTDLFDQLEGADGKFVLSENNKEYSIASWVEVIDNCLHFNINTKTLVGKVVSALEQSAVSETYYLKTSAILSQLEQYLNDLSFDLECDIVFKHCTIAGLLKSAGVSIRNEYDDPLEKIIDYMELVREFDKDKLFVFVNLRSFFTDDQVEMFLETVSTHEYRVLLLDSVCRKKLSKETRITIDNDLCEF